MYLRYFQKVLKEDGPNYVATSPNTAGTGGAVGNIQDAEISMKEWTKINNTLFELLGEYCGKDAKQVKKDSSRDLWLDSEQALEYGIIDEIVKTKKKGK